MSILNLIAKGLAAAGVFTPDATGEDLEAILPSEVVTEINKSTVSAPSIKENEMAHEEGDGAFDISEVDLPEEVVNYISELEGQVLALSKRAGTEDDGTEAVYEKVLKSMDPAVAAIFKADRERLAVAEAELAIEKADRIRKTFVAKARGFSNLADDPEVLADVLQEVSAYSQDAANKLETILAEAESRLAKSALFTEVGTSRPGETGDAFLRATAIAKRMVEDGSADSVETARSIVWEANPELYNAYQAERRAAVR